MEETCDSVQQSSDNASRVSQQLAQCVTFSDVTSTLGLYL